MTDPLRTPWLLSATELSDVLRDGRISSVAVTKACLARIAENDPEVGAWAHVDEDTALAQAEAADQRRFKGKPLGALHGLPVGIKDIFDVRGMPTGLGSTDPSTEPAKADSAVAEKLRAAGAVIIGKTTTSPFASGANTTARNPHDPTRTPGGSSSGSAAAVAAGHVPLSVGSQTNGSVVRPASYCGVYGFKPSRGMVSRHGCLKTSETLDQVGVFARSLEDTALLTGALMGYDRADPAMNCVPLPDPVAGVAEAPGVDPMFAWFDLPYWDRVEASARDALEAVLEALGDRVERHPAPKTFQDVIDSHRAVHQFEYHRNMSGHPALPDALIPNDLRPFLDAGSKVSEDDYRAALALLAGAETFFDAFFMDFDAILAPASLGVAPVHAAGTGDPICQTVWTFAGLPSLGLPWLSGDQGLPLGVQAISARGEDDRLMRTAKWLETTLGADDAA
ncbi:MAG: amidase [Alphaproteobacteria bacterium]|nr:amidase [Alphaproteobacteria bacterium]